MRNKKGSHVGMILSFVIFITFIVFLYSILQPAIKTNQDKKAILEYLKTEIMNNISSELITTSILIDGDYPLQDCFKIAKAFPGEVIAKDSDKIIKHASSTEDLITVTGIAPEDGGYGAGFYWILYSAEFFSGGLEPCDSPKALIPKENYKIGFVTRNDYVFEKLAEDFISKYNEDYNAQKSELGSLGSIEYGFGFKDSEGNLIETSATNVATDVYKEEIPTEYIDEEGSLKFGYIYVSVW